MRAMAALKGAPVTILAMHIRLSLQARQEVGLNVIGEMAARYKVPVGFSDHTMGYAASFAAAAMGATVIEKHFTYSRLMLTARMPSTPWSRTSSVSSPRA